MFRSNKVIEVVHVDSMASLVPVAIEQFPSKDFFNNPAGWSRNDLAALAAATSKQEYDMLVERLKVNEPTFDVKDGVKVADAIKAIKPRWCQSANEVVSYVDAITRQGLDEAYVKSLEDLKVDGDKVDQDSSPVDSKTE